MDVCRKTEDGVANQKQGGSSHHELCNATLRADEEVVSNAIEQPATSPGANSELPEDDFGTEANFEQQSEQKVSASAACKSYVTHCILE